VGMGGNGNGSVFMGMEIGGKVNSRSQSRTAVQCVLKP